MRTDGKSIFMALGLFVFLPVGLGLAPIPLYARLLLYPFLAASLARLLSR